MSGCIKSTPPKHFCTKCRIKKTKNDFYMNHRNTNGHSTHCIECSKKYQKKYREPYKTGCWWVDMYIEISKKENREAGKICW